jgi:hypothetical protein
VLKGMLRNKGVRAKQCHAFSSSGRYYLIPIYGMRMTCNQPLQPLSAIKGRMLRGVHKDGVVHAE